ncbi:hypothetical protein FQN55_007811 [Onygenales sp. PD_40]|nr:hypothetical protein FQN55_007811 [Onygenales sp. PD_40]KAK2787304.1 hypothetical protein FQN53_005463 [Emmonsiellopsis sp. PD_33]
MKATPLLISWHDDNAPIYSTHFDPRGKGRLATAGNDNNVRLWKVEATGEERRVTYLSTLIKHTQAVNVVRFSPKGEMLASAGDDGNVLLWVPSELQSHGGLGEDRSDDQETWRVKHMCRSSGAEIYDLAWSPDGIFFITGSMDNIARIYNAQTGQMVRQIAEHSHYVQGVAWDPLNEFVATQSSDRSEDIVKQPSTPGSTLERPVHEQHFVSGIITWSIHSRNSNDNGTPNGSSPSFTQSSVFVRFVPIDTKIGFTRTLYATSSGQAFGGIFSELLRRLTFAPDGSLLFTPAGQYKTSHGPHGDHGKATEDVINTVYIYTRAGFNKPPIAHLPGQKKPSVAVKCSPVFYTLRQGAKPTRHVTLDTSSGEDAFPSLPDSVVSGNITSNPSMEPPPPLGTATTCPKTGDQDNGAQQSPSPAFALPYRIVYAVATQDAVLVYDTQQQTPLCVVSNLHYATFTDLTWSNDGLTLIMSSSDGFCSTLSFSPGELGQVYTPSTEKPQHHPSTAISSTNTTPLPTPTMTTSPALAKPSPIFSAPTPPSSTSIIPPRPASPAGSATSSITQLSSGVTPSSGVINNPTPTLGSVPSVTATNSAPAPGLPLSTPPQTPMSGISHSATSSVSGSVLGKRDLGAVSESERDESKGKNEDKPQEAETAPPVVKKRRVAPTLISGDGATAPPRPSDENK